MNSSIWTMVIIIYSIACGGFCAFVAKEKNRDSGWFFLGLIFGILALIAVAGVPKLKPTKREYSIKHDTETDEIIKELKINTQDTSRCAICGDKFTFSLGSVCVDGIYFCGECAGIYVKHKEDQTKNLKT